MHIFKSLCFLKEINKRSLTNLVACITEVKSKTQGSRPRPRAQKNFEAKDRPSRGQGQGPRTQRQVFSQKKSSKIFSGDLKKKGLQKFFSGEKGLQKIFFQGIST